MTRTDTEQWPESLKRFHAAMWDMGAYDPECRAVDPCRQRCSEFAGSYDPKVATFALAASPPTLPSEGALSDSKTE
jgi:hypothetical protein